MKKPNKKQDQLTRNQPLQNQPVQTERSAQAKADLVQLCKGFVDSAYYRKAMLEPGYLREEAIRDFLISLDQPFDQGLIERMRKNYYQSF